MKFLLPTSLLLLACLCSTTRAAGPMPEAPPTFTITLRGQPTWNRMEEVRADLGPDVLISGRTVDLRGARISGKKLKHPRRPQDENSVGVRIGIKGFTLKNGFVDDIPGGLIAHAPRVTFQNLTFSAAGEDFVSNMRDSSEDFRVLGCRFFNNKKGDKSIQANDARGLVIAGNLICSGTTAIRIQKKNAKKQGGRAIVESNRFHQVNTAVNAAGRVTLFLRNNIYEAVSTELKTDGAGVKLARQ
jgi:hypothetical protein